MTYDYAPYSGAINGYTVWTYDVLNRPKSRTLYTSSGAVDRSTTFGYLGRTTTTTDPLVPSNVTQRITDVSGRLRQVIDPSPGGTTQYIFDAFGNLNKTIDAKGIVSSASYNLRGFRTQMMDADAGTWNFVPDSLNELVSWTDAKGQSFSAVFDPLGRITSKTEPEGTNIWTWGNSAAAFNIGQLASISGYGYAGHPYSEILTYDSLSRLGNRSITTDQNYQFNYTYNTIGEMATLAYPASPIPAGTGPRYTIQYQYSYGFPFQIQDVTNATAPATIWALGSANDYSSPLTETLGTGVGATIVTSTYKPWTNQVLSIQAGVGGSLTNRQNLAYLWDVDDNLTQRRDLNQILTENFVPDALNRLSSSTLNGASNLSVGYDAAGDITSRSDVGTYSYGNAAHPHGVTAAGSSTYTYDANGNVATRNGLANTWTSYNLPSVLQASVSGVTLKTTLVYGPEHERVGQQAFELNGTELTSYVGGILEKMGASTTQLLYWRHYVNTPTGRTIIVSRNSDLSTSTSLVLSDHLGSSDAIINGVTGALNVQESFSPFGLRRQSNWAAGIPTYWDQVAITENTRHGFTGHDQLDNVGLIHMNGRVYDPVVGRFMSVDPDPGEPGNSQRLNPYSYVSNRPLVATDPTGFADSTVFNDVIAGSQGGGQGAGGHDSTEDHRTDIRIIDNSTQNDTSGPGNVQNKSAQPSTQPTAPVAATVAAATAEGTLQEIVVSGLRRVVIAAATEAAVVAAVATTVVAMLSISGDTHVDTSGHNDKPKSPPPPAPTGTSQSTPADPNGQGDDENNKKEQDKKTTDQQPNLRRIHSDETLNSGSNKFNLESLRKQTTEKIVESLKPGQPEALKVKPDGSIFDGNTRIKILQERGFDVNSLPREIMK